MCLPSLTAPQVDLSLTYENGVEFEFLLYGFDTLFFPLYRKIMRIQPLSLNILFIVGARTGV